MMSVGGTTTMTSPVDAGPQSVPEAGPDWDEVRAQFALDPAEAHMTCCFLAPLPLPVREAVERYRLAFERNVLWAEKDLYGIHNGLQGDVVRALAEYIGGRPEDIALTANTSAGLGVVYSGLRLRPDQEIVLSVHDHLVHEEAARFATQRHGASLRSIRLYDDPAHATSHEIAERVAATIGPRTRVVGVPWVHSCTGVKASLPLLAEAVAVANEGRAEEDRCLLIIDGVHGLGVEDVDVARTGVDFFASGTHKWMLGPRGTGFVWGAEDAWAQLGPVFPSLILDRDYWQAFKAGAELPPTRAKWMSPGGFQAFENRFAVADAVAFHQSLGRNRVAARIAELNTSLRLQLRSLPHLELVSPLEESAASQLVCFRHHDLPAREVLRLLAEHKVYGTITPEMHDPAARLCAGLMNGPEHIDAAINTLADL
ncbi:aminotransferase class V-fold PLP-dependent enzyme [Streptomyces rectiverticillatus]|uniref:aminotransferase class V-fold PLP-dependent enzyme n=1 Tax=Streptomyces rectiverticillatus TaxID=173860 RepID=UPI0015C2F706|nr:aminotransferase class V-fold PLP-dependent enzyme [Streptomyces rectiverticillatus]QLE74598.1 aminotransferase class V-fold PLP-dependent enzyme [Streptomyces rectiverticillatus]